MTLLTESIDVTRRLRQVDRVAVAILLLFSVLAIIVPAQAGRSLVFMLEALGEIAPFLLLSVLIAGSVKATGLDRQIALAFAGHPLRAVILASAFGALSPFCSCGVVPLISGLLVAGVPLAPVMAFWLASPLMDPQMFLLMTPVFGLPMTVAKLLAAFGIGLSAGLATQFLVGQGWFADQLRPALTISRDCGAPDPFAKSPIVWRFWDDPGRRHSFLVEGWTMGWFLLKWLTLAFLLESLMIAYLPADQIGTVVGGASWLAIPVSVLIGIPAYLNGFAAIPTVSGLMELGMAPGAALGFMLAGGATCIPAAVAILALVKRPVFLWYVTCALAGSLMAAYLFQIFSAVAGPQAF